MHRGNSRVVLEQAGLPGVELQGLAEQRCVEPVDRGSGHQLLHHHHGVPYLRRELDRRDRKPGRPSAFLHRQRPGPQILQTRVRLPFQH